MGGSRRLDEAGEQLREDFFRIMREVGRSHRNRSDDQVDEMQGFVQRWRDWDRRNGGDGGANRTPNPVLANNGSSGDGGADGGYDAVVLAGNDLAPDWVAHPDQYSVATAAMSRAERRDYLRGDVRGHHVHGLADGGAGQQPTITFTGETIVDGSWHHRTQPSGPLVDGQNPNHRAATNLQNLVWNWQRGEGIR